MSIEIVECFSLCVPSSAVVVGIPLLVVRCGIGAHPFGAVA